MPEDEPTPNYSQGIFCQEKKFDVHMWGKIITGNISCMSSKVSHGFWPHRFFFFMKFTRAKFHIRT